MTTVSIFRGWYVTGVNKGVELLVDNWLSFPPFSRLHSRLLVTCTSGNFIQEYDFTMQCSTPMHVNDFILKCKHSYMYVFIACTSLLWVFVSVFYSCICFLCHFQSPSAVLDTKLPDSPVVVLQPQSPNIGDLKDEVFFAVFLLEPQWFELTFVCPEELGTCSCF